MQKSSPVAVAARAVYDNVNRALRTARASAAEQLRGSGVWRQLAR
jgi:hypothetical protein